MPDKRNESKIMAMLERKGIVRKAGSEEDLSEAEVIGTRELPETDLRSLFGKPAGDIPKVTPATRQPVPGMPNPIIPPERPQIIERVEPKPIERVVPLSTRPIERAEPRDIQPIESAIPQQRKPAERDEPQQQRPVEIPAPTPFLASNDPFRDDSYKEEPVTATFETTQVDSSTLPRAVEFGSPHQPITYESEYPPQPPPIENYTERYLDIEELFEVLAVKCKKTDTIYLIEEYVKSLPESLPVDSRREIVGKIVAASGFDYDLLMGDGVLRVRTLKEYAEKFARHTDDYIISCQADIDELDQQIARLRKLIENRRDLHKKQFFAIEAEAQRLKEILTFISG